MMRDAIHQKVEALFPAHEIDEFTELFWDRIQLWREQEGSKVTKTVSRWYSPGCAQDITLARWGHCGQPVLLFPTAGGDAEEAERMELIGAIWPLIEAGRDQGLLLRQRRGQGAGGQGGLGRRPLLAAQPVPRLRRPRGGAGDPHRLRGRRASRWWRPARRSAPSTRLR